MNLSVVSYVLKASIRDKLFLSLLLIMVVAVSLSIFIGSAAITETDITIVTFMASAARFIGVLSLILFTVFYIRRAFETHDIEYLLSRPISRASFIISHLCALSALSILFVVLIAGGLLILSGSYLNMSGFALWALSLTFEFMIVAYAALFFAMVLPSAVTSTMATLAGYILARMSGQVLNIIDEGTHGSGSSYFMGKIMEAASVIVPRFDLFTQSSWLIYGPDAVIGSLFILVHGALFLFLIGCAAIFDLIQKEF